MALKPASKLDGIEISEIRKMNALAKSDTINLGIGQLPNDIPMAVCEAGVASFLNGAIQYTRNQGSIELCSAIAEKHSNRIGKETSEKEVIITNGAEGALWNILYTYLNEGDEVLIPEIAFSVYETITKMQKGKIITYSLSDSFEMNLKEIESKITNKTKFIVINNPNNPTGKLYNSSEIEKFANIINKYENLYCISDEIYKELYLDGEITDTPAKYSDKVIVVDGISKSASATGLRIGWTIASEEITKPMVISNQYITTCATATSQKAALPVLNGECLDFEKNLRIELTKNRDYAYKILSSIPNISVEKPQGAFYIFPNISYFGKSKEIAIKLLESKNVLTIPGIAFGERGDDFIRLSYAMDFEVLKEGLDKIVEFFV